MTPMAGSLRRLERLLRDRRLLLLFFAAVAFSFTQPLFAHAMNLGHGDWLWYHFVWDSERRTILEYHELPWWNPYYCGGSVGIANPQSFALSPLFWLLLPFPTAVAMKLYLALTVFLGLWGAHELARAMKITGLGPLLGAVVFGCSGIIGWHMNGQTSMAVFELLPWLALWFLRAVEDPRFSLAAGAVLAIMATSAGVYPTITGALMMVLMASLQGVYEGKWGLFRALRAGALSALAMVGFAALKLLPMLDFLRDHRRPIERDDAISWHLLLEIFLVKRTTTTQLWPHVGYMYAWWGEYGDYLGVLGLVVGILCLLASVQRLRMEAWLALLFLAIAMGEHGRWAPYSLLRKLPVLGNLRVPTRYLTAFNLWLGIAMARWTTRTWRWSWLRRSRGLRAALVSLVLGLSGFLVVDLVRTNGRAVFEAAMPTPPAPENTSGLPYRQVPGVPWAMYQFPPRNEGSLRCFDELHVEISPRLIAHLPAELYLRTPSAGSVELTSWSPSRWDVHVALSRSARLVLNQNYFRGWAASIGELSSDQGLVVVDLPAGERALSIRYTPPGHALAWGLTLVTMGLAGVVLTRALVARRRS